MKPALSLAPLRGVTVAAFRRIHAEHFGGIDYAVAPFISLAAGETIAPRLLKDVLPEHNGTVKTMPQLIGKDPKKLRVMIRVLMDLGYTEVNLNCGCPWKFIARKGRGSGLPENETLFQQMLEAGCDMLPNGFSIKIRLGMKTNDTLSKRAEMIARFPLSEIIIHPRTGVQMYEGTADHDVFAKIYRNFGSIPVVYNGDIFTPADYARVVKRFPEITGIMLGRGLIANPALAEHITAWEKAGRNTIPAGQRNPSRTFSFIEELTAEYRKTLFGPASLLGRLKELWGYIYAEFDNGPKMLRTIQRAHSFAEYNRAVASLRK